MIFEVAFYYYLDVAVVSCGFNAVMYRRQPEPDVIDIEIAEAGIFTIDDLDRRSLLAVAAAVDYKKVPLSEDEFIKSHKGSFIVCPGLLFATACSAAKTDLSVKAWAGCLIHSAEFLTETVSIDYLFQLAPCLIARGEERQGDLVIIDTPVFKPDISVFVGIAVNSPPETRPPLRPVVKWFFALNLRRFKEKGYQFATGTFPGDISDKGTHLHGAPGGVV